MLAQYKRLTTKDVRYIQKQRNIIRTEHFGFLWIPQYANRNHHQASIYIAADTVKKSSRRHQLKRQLLEHLQVQLQPALGQNYYKIFVFLNKKTVHQTQFTTSKAGRDEAIVVLRNHFIREWSIVNKKLAH